MDYDAFWTSALVGILMVAVDAVLAGVALLAWLFPAVVTGVLWRLAG
jgi:hypothetical protein